MGTKLFPSNVLEQAQTVFNAWNQIGSNVTFGTLLPESLSNDLTAAADIESQISNLELQLTSTRNQRDDLLNVVWEKVKRVRSGIKANFGDDSNEYEMVGGTRRSERKPRARKAASEA